MSTDDQPKSAGMEDVSDMLDPVMLIPREQGRYKCLCGKLYSREIVVIACTARSHEPNPNKEQR